MGATVLMDYEFMDKHERMELLRKKDFDRYFNMLSLATRESDGVARCIMYAARLHGCVIVGTVGNSERWWFLHRSAKYGSDLQLTTWDDYGPVGDVRVSRESDMSAILHGRIVVGIERTY